MKTRRFLLCAAALILLAITSCKKSDDVIYTPNGPYANGAFISNEGTFGTNNASVSYYDFAGDSVRNSIYYTVNNRALGKSLQSIYISGGYAYMMMNMSDTVVVTTRDTFKNAGFIVGLSSPRYMTAFNNKGYITQWGESGVVKVVDLSLNSVIRTVKVGTGPEQALVAGGNILVCNGGAYTDDSTVMVINPASDRVVDTITVGHNPKEMAVDKNGDIWVLCYGYIQYDTAWNISLELPSKLVRLSGQNYKVKAEFIISTNQHPQHLGISADKSTVYYGGGYGFTGIYAMNITDTSVPTVALIPGKMFNGFDVNPANGDLYCVDAGDYVNPGTLFRYSAQGTLIKQYTVGVAPNGTYFR